jgi:hypothetical protein
MCAPFLKCCIQTHNVAHLPGHSSQGQALGYARLRLCPRKKSHPLPHTGLSTAHNLDPISTTIMQSINKPSHSVFIAYQVTLT